MTVTLTDLNKKIKSRVSITPKERYDRIKHCFDTKRSAAEFLGQFGGQTVAICGGGPSLGYTLDELRHLKKWAGAKIVAINKTHDFLIENGIVPDFCVLLDPREWVKTYVKPHKDVKYLVASQVHPAVWDNLEGYDVYCWHALAHNHGSEEFRVVDLKKFKKFSKGKPYMAIGGGVTAGLRAWTMCAAPFMGFSYIHFFGFDSCARGKEELYAYKKDSSVQIDTKYFRLKLVDPHTGKDLPRIYYTNFSMQAQAANIEEFFRQYAIAMLQKRLPATSFIFHGDGLVPDWAALKMCHFDPDHIEKMRNYKEPNATIEHIILDSVPIPTREQFLLTPLDGLQETRL